MAVVFNDLHSSMPTSAQAIRLSIDMRRIYSRYDENHEIDMMRFNSLLRTMENALWRMPLSTQEGETMNKNYVDASGRTMGRNMNMPVLSNVRIAAIDEAGMMVGPQAIRRPGSASSSSTTSDDMPLLADVASDDELPPLEELPPTPDDVIYCTTSLGGGVRIVAGATRVAAMRFAAEQMFTQMLQQRGSERLLPSLDIAPQANATPEQQCTRCPYHERALVEREVERLLTTVLGSRHVREPRQFLRRILHRILELV